MTDWTLVFTSVGSATVTGLVGYSAARIAAKTTADQIRSNAETARAAIEGENERLREQHREDHLRNRQGTYHKLLHAESRLHGAMIDNRGDVLVLFDEFTYAADGVAIFGAAEVEAATRDLVAVYTKAMRDAEAMQTDQLRWEHLSPILRARTDELAAARGVLTNAMRKDVGPAR